MQILGVERKIMAGKKSNFRGIKMKCQKSLHKADGLLPAWLKVGYFSLTLSSIVNGTNTSLNLFY